MKKLKVGDLCFVCDDDDMDITESSYIGKIGKIIKFSGIDVVILKFGNIQQSGFYKSELIKIG